MTEPQIFLGIPSYDGRVRSEIVNAVLGAVKTHGLLKTIQIQSGSWLTRNFNTLYAAALNARKDGITHFCMLHDDLIPQRFGWLETMLGIMNSVGAGVLSVVSPLKSPQGLTSTALDVPNGTRMLKRLTMHEVFHDFPPTFTHEKILLNTGCMLIDISQDWADKLWFRFEDGIRVIVNGSPVKRDIHPGGVTWINPPDRFEAVGVSEDWDFSRRARELGASLWATREIPVIHYGNGAWSNANAWGSLETDQ